ncbi:CRISPR-associated endonuclease Cas2 [Endozoicomonas euniceicola]|uniref:CRISPR-associated endoribonuclease Cas2 n=1 Tax=Endozoicomonas euniceicola TaxID=1234143 RepID=A0ABY6GUC1_9GAMM|nr:CRISPR-associated endonuclease Cas2 [Endozoicomonas euniceicola]UYM15643.1 CRISPR-associated endonuclease Cas2 [Endozoicomonas euniceicola]
MAAEQDWLICYDIKDARRLARVHRLMRQEALSLQRSVFFGRFQRSVLNDLVEAIEPLIDPDHDDVRLFPQQAQSAIKWCGCPPLPEGIEFSASPKVIVWNDPHEEE